MKKGPEINLSPAPELAPSSALPPAQLSKPESKPESKPRTSWTCFGSFLHSFTALDMFGKKAELYLPSGKSSYKTLTGVFSTLLVVAIPILYCLLLLRDGL